MQSSDRFEYLKIFRSYYSSYSTCLNILFWPVSDHPVWKMQYPRPGLGFCQHGPWITVWNLGKNGITLRTQNCSTFFSSTLDFTDFTTYSQILELGTQTHHYFSCKYVFAKLYSESDKSKIVSQNRVNNKKPFVLISFARVFEIYRKFLLVSPYLFQNFRV